MCTCTQGNVYMHGHAFINIVAHAIMNSCMSAHIHMCRHEYACSMNKCVQIYTCMYHLYVHSNLHRWIHMHNVHSQAHMHTCMHVYMRAHLHVFVRMVDVCMWARALGCMCAGFMCAHMSIRMCACTRIRMRTNSPPHADTYPLPTHQLPAGHASICLGARGSYVTTIKHEHAC